MFGLWAPDWWVVSRQEFAFVFFLRRFYFRVIGLELWF